MTAKRCANREHLSLYRYGDPVLRLVTEIERKTWNNLKS